MLKISIITVVFNSKRTISEAIESVLTQTYPNVEYIIVDGESTDGTVEIIKSFGNRIDKFISEPDNGLYDAMNKGVAMATGDVVGILNSDDLYYDNETISKVMAVFNTQDTDSVFGDIIFVDPYNTQNVVRYYRSNRFKLKDFRRGMMPAHTSFFVKRNAYTKYGLYNTNYKISADFDLLLRFLYINKISYTYLPKVLIIMRMGGISTQGISSVLLMNKENLKICKNHGVKTNLFRIYSKYFKKIFQFLRRPKVA